MLNVLLPAVLAGCLSGAGDPDAPRRGLAKLAIATGTVETREGAEGDYKALEAGGQLEANLWVRTGAKAKAVFDFSDGSELRINENTELLVAGARQIELKIGQIYVVASNNPGSPFQIKTQYSPLTLPGGSVSVSFVNRDPSDPQVKTVSRTVTTIISVDGTTNVGSKRYDQKLTMGYWCTLVDATLNTPDQIGDFTIPTRWVHELLVKRGKPSPEVDKRLDSMLRMLGRYPKGEEDLSDKGYRSLGELSAAFLAKYLAIPPSAMETTRRRAAVRVLADVGTKAQIPELVAVLQDPDVETRAPAAKALERLAGTNLKFDEAYWKGEKVEAGQKAWQEWLKEWLKKNAPKK